MPYECVVATNGERQQGKADRKERLTQALRANLKRRKARQQNQPDDRDYPEQDSKPDYGSN